MKKVLLAALLILALMLTGCFGSKEESTTEPDEEVDLSVAEDMLMKNDFFGFGITIPKGWYVIGINNPNLSTGETDTSDESTLDYNEQNGIKYMSFAEFMTTLDQSEAKNIEIRIFAEKLDVDLEGYKKQVEETMKLDTNGLPFYLVSEETRNVNEVSYIYSHYETKVSEDVEEKDLSCIDYYLREVNGYYFNIAVLYWKEYSASVESDISPVFSSITWQQ